MPPVAVEDFLGHGFEDLLFGRGGRFFVAPDCGKERCCAPAGLVEADAGGIADGLPDALSLVLAVDKEAFAACGQDADAEAFQIGAADVVCGPAGFEGLDPALAEADIRHGFSSCGLLQAGGGGGSGCILPQICDFTRKTCAILTC